ncbi:hypothetical protein Patl1_22767 [Pistacia atlantica]|uniref:Uncharacterized protein n=1 Tax=Pistacia atlantica TaxID=434234 RepID=A0ACC0ZZA6_9ROSI|nr:hypothetical protein Patl1_22767 [Pistacia atlantica]
MCILYLLALVTDMVFNLALQPIFVRDHTFVSRKYSLINLVLRLVQGSVWLECALSQAKAAKVILTDGDLSTLVNLRSNLDLNQLNIETDFSENEDSNVVKCIHLPWESASESEVHDFMPEIVLGADVIYDPTCLPHLIRVLSILLNQKKSDSPTQKESCKGSIRDSEYGHDRVNDTNQGKILCANDLDRMPF